MKLDYTGPRQGLPLQTVEDGRAPKTRIESADDAMQIVGSLMWANQDRSRFNAKIKGMIDGNAPYSAAKLRASGQAWRTNINFLEGKAQLSSALVPYYDLFSGSPQYASVQSAWGNPDDQESYSQVITEEFDLMLKQYEGFDFNMQSMLFDMLGFGKGFLMWPDKSDWRFRYCAQHRVFVPDGTEAYGGNLEILMVRQSFYVHELWGFIKNKETAQAVGWDVQETARAIGHAMPRIEGVDGDNYNYDFVQQRIKDRDITEGIRSATVQAAHLFVKEFSGKISHCIVLEHHIGDDDGRATRYLFKKTERYEKWCQVISTFFFETLEGSWNGASGLGRDIFAPMEIKNRMHCSKFDNVFMRSGITLQARSANSLQKTNLVQVGAFNIIPPDYDVLQAGIFGDVEGLMAANREMDHLIQSNTGIYKPRMEKPEGNPRTAAEVTFQYQASAVLGNSAINRFYLNLDRLYREIYSRASNPNQVGDEEGKRMARAFHQRCADRGVPMEAIVKVRAVRAMRNIGNGSALMRKQSMAALSSVFPMLPESGKRNWLKDMIAVNTNQEMVGRYMPSRDLEKLPDDHQATAMLENAAMKIGAPVAWTPTQNNVIHAQTHLQAAAMAASTLQQGANPTEVAAYLDAVGAHTAVHLQQIANDPTRKVEYDMLNEQFMQLAKIADSLNEQNAKAQEQQAQQQQEAMAAQQQAAAIASGQDPDTAIKMATAQVDARLKAAKTQQMLDQRQAKFNQDMALKDARTAAELSRGA